MLIGSKIFAEVAESLSNKYGISFDSIVIGESFYNNIYWMQSRVTCKEQYWNNFLWVIERQKHWKKCKQNVLTKA